MTVGLGLLSRLAVESTTLEASLYMLVVGLGIGMTMQVLVLAVQNAVSHRFMGVATSGAMLFRQVGGSIGVALCGAIFANRLHANLAEALPGASLPSTADPAAVRHLPAAIHGTYVTAFADSLTPVFLVTRRGRPDRVRAQLVPARGAAAEDPRRRRDGRRDVRARGGCLADGHELVQLVTALHRPLEHRAGAADVELVVERRRARAASIPRSSSAFGPR